MMKKLLFIAFMVIFSLHVSAQIKLAVRFDGYWSDWNIYGTSIRGNYSSFIIYDRINGPWEYFFKFQIDGFYIPDKQTLKENYKYGQWYEYYGTVEYYISDDFQSAYEAFKSKKGPAFIRPKQENGRPTKKIVSPAKIKIAPYKDHPRVYNIWYDNVCLGIDLYNSSFKK